MNEMHAVIGYLPDATAQAAARGGLKETLRVSLEQGKDQAQVHIDPADVLGVMMGPSQKGETAVQVLLKPSASVQTVARTSFTDWRGIPDWNLVHPGRPPIVAIYVHPQYVKQLVDLSAKSLSQ
ncbi:MAG: hypothetical protein WDO17_12070 [Alphaproteobacteria bacterium]